MAGLVGHPITDRQDGAIGHDGGESWCPCHKHGYAQALAAAADVRPWVSGPGRLAFLLGDRMASLTRSMRVSNRRFAQGQRMAAELSQRALRMARHSSSGLTGTEDHQVVPTRAPDV